MLACWLQTPKNFDVHTNWKHVFIFFNPISGENEIFISHPLNKEHQQAGEGARFSAWGN